MKQCPLCGEPIQDSDLFCTSCGSQPTAPQMAAQTDAVTGVETVPLAQPATAQPIPPQPAITQPTPPAQTTASAQAAVPMQPTAFPLHAAQAAYGQGSPQSPYMQQPTYGTPGQPVPPQPQAILQPSSMYRGAPAPDYGQNETVTLGEWMLNYLILIIPMANIVMLCIWAFGGSAKLSVRNWARASLIWMAIGTVLIIVFMVFMMFMVANMISYGDYGY